MEITLDAEATKLGKYWCQAVQILYMEGVQFFLFTTCTFYVVV